MKPRHPLFWALLAGVAVLVAAFAPVVWQMLRPSAAPAPAPLALRHELPPPWQIDRGPQGELRAFGLRLPGSTLADAVERWGDDMRVALIANRGGVPALEAYTDRWTGGGVNGKLVLASDAQPAAVMRWTDRSSKRETIDANAQRWALAADDRADALRSAVVGLSFLPASRVDAATLKARFGAPSEELPGEGATTHWLYPDRGLAITFDPGTGKSVMQVVALGDFEARLRAPVVAAAGAARAASAATAAPAPLR